MHTAVPITTYWSKKKGTPGAVLKSVRPPVNWLDPSEWLAFPHAWTALFHKRDGGSAF